MTIQQMMYIEAIAQAGSISKAASELYSAQSSLSAAVREVESEYGIAIFERTSKGVRLTLQGREFLADIRHILEYYQHVDRKYKNAERTEKQFCVVSHHHVCGEKAFLQLLSSSNGSGHFLGYLEGNTTFVLDHVENKIAEIGIIFFTQSAKSMLLQDIRRRDMIFNHIAYTNMHIYVHKNHPLAYEKSVTREQIVTYPFITYDNLNPAAGKATTSMQQWSNVQQLFYVSDRATVYSILRSTFAYATGAGYLSPDERNSDIISIPVFDLESIEVGWVVKTKYALSELASTFIEILKEIYC